MQLFRGMIGHPVQYILQPFGRMDALQFTGADKGINNGCILGAFMRTGK
jgi:hypothetical protein